MNLRLLYLDWAAMGASLSRKARALSDHRRAWLIVNARDAFRAARETRRRLPRRLP